jgi:hypothetical protein
LGDRRSHPDIAADIGFHQELTGHDMDMSVHDKGFAMQRGHRLILKAQGKTISCNRLGKQRLYGKNMTGYRQKCQTFNNFSALHVYDPVIINFPFRHLQSFLLVKALMYAYSGGRSPLLN